MNVSMMALRLFLLILFFDGQLGIALDRVWDEDVRIRGPLSAVGTFKDLNSELFVKDPGSPCHGQYGIFKWMQNLKKHPNSLFRKHLDLKGEPCEMTVIPHKLQGKRGKDVSTYNWNSFGLRYGKRVAENGKK